MLMPPRTLGCRSWNGAAFWNVGSGGVLAVSRTATGVNASFHVEWQVRASLAAPTLASPASITTSITSLRVGLQDKEWFCLRSLADLRVVEVMPSDAAQPWVLRAVRYGCSQPAQLFAYRGHSIFSKGASSMVKVPWLTAADAATHHSRSPAA